MIGDYKDALQIGAAIMIIGSAAVLGIGGSFILLALLARTLGVG